MRRLLLVVVVSCGAPSQPQPTAPRTAAPAPTAPRIEPPPADLSTPEGRMLALVNSYRAAAGVPPVTLDPALAKGCREHTEYLKLNYGKPQVYSTRAHTQDPTLPGASADGAACGKAADLYQNVGDLELAVHGWMAGLYHRRPIVSPDIEKVGVGYTLLGSSYIVALQFVYAHEWRGTPILFPANGQHDVPVDFTREEPNPIPPPTIFAGFPITLQFSRGETLTGATATLVDGSGTPVAFWLSSPEHPASPYNMQTGLIGVIPQQPLRTSTRYTATITVARDGAPQTWTTTFTTMQRITVDAADEAAVYASLGKPILLRGTLRGGGKLTEGSARLSLDMPRGPHIHSLEIELPLPVLQATNVPFAKLKGMHVEVEGRVVNDSGYARLDVTPVSAFRLTN